MSSKNAGRIKYLSCIYLMVLNSMLINGPNYRIIWLTISGKFNNPPFLIPSFIKLDSLTNVKKMNGINYKFYVMEIQLI